MKKKTLCLIILLAMSVFLVYDMQLQTVKAEEGWLTGWSNRKSHVINPASGAGTNYQIKVKAVYEISFCEQGLERLGLDTFEASDVDSNGNLFVGINYKIYKSTNNGKTFSLIFTIPSQSNPHEDYAGRVWCVFVDSRDYIFVSAGSTNRLYRSTNGGQSFSEVLNLNRASNDGQIVTMAEDQNGYLYAAEFCTPTSPSPRLWKSTDGGLNWSSIRSWNVRHLHGVAFNPYNNWLYILTGEDSGTERDRVYRSKDGGATWQLLVDAQAVNVPYLAINFIDDWVYLGQDTPYDYSHIQRFRDDGVSEPFTPTTVFVNPYNYSPWMSSTKIGNYLVFASVRDVYDSFSLIVKTANGVDWEILSTYATKYTDRLTGQLTKHARKGQAFVTITAGASTYVTNTSLFDLVGLNEKSRTDFGDVRFTDDDGQTLLDYWMEEKVDGKYAVFQVEVADNLSSQSQTIYIYYGKSDAETTSNGVNAFLFFDDFSGSSYDPVKWETVGSPTVSVSNGYVSISRNSYSGSWSAHGLKTKTFAVDEARILVKAKTSSTHPSLTAGYACSQFTSKGARNGVGFAEGEIFIEVDGRDEGRSNTLENAQPYSTNTFYSLYLYRWQASYAKIFVNGAYKSQVTTNVRDGSRSVAIWIEEWGSFSAKRDVVVDWIAVAKYVDVEPTHGSWGNEELGEHATIDQTFVTDGRADVGSVQTIGFHAKWTNGSDVVGGSIYLNGTGYVTDSTGWINTNVYSSKVEKDIWTVTGFNCNGVTSYSQTVQNPSVIWDRIKIADGGVSKGLLMLGEKATVWFKAQYEYDDDTFDGANGVLYSNGFPMSWSATNNEWEYDYTANTVGTQSFTISGISDSLYSLTVMNDAAGAQTLDVWSLPFYVISNSTISELSFNSTSRVLSFTVSGPSGTVGCANVTIAKTLIANINELEVSVDGNQINYAATSTDYSWLIHFTYGHSSHNIVIALGSPSVESSKETPLGIATGVIVTAAVLIVTAMLTVILLYAKTHQRYQSRSSNAMNKNLRQKTTPNQKSSKRRVKRKNRFKANKR